MSAPAHRAPHPGGVRRPVGGGPAGLEVLAPARELSWATAAAILDGALRPVTPSVRLVTARGEGRTHLAPQWGSHGLCGALLDASSARAADVTCRVCASRLPPEAE